jgi:predicted DNA binding CopG/RHH family protein
MAGPVRPSTGHSHINMVIYMAFYMDLLYVWLVWARKNRSLNGIPGKMMITSTSTAYHSKLPNTLSTIRDVLSRWIASIVREKKSGISVTGKSTIALLRLDLHGEKGKSDYLAPDTGVMEGVFTMKKTKYTEAPPDIKEAIEQSEVIEDFLPEPNELVFKEDNVKVTLQLSRRSINLFKRYAGKKGYKYQRMIRNLVDQYAEKALTH